MDMNNNKVVINSISEDNTNKNIKKSNSGLQHYFTYVFLMSMLITTVWLMGKSNIYLIKCWFAILLSILLTCRIVEYIRSDQYHFLAELCYYINVITIIMVNTDIDIRYIYPFHHGPLLLFCILFRDAFIPHSLPRTISFAIHTFGTIITRKIYWSESSDLWLNEITWESYIYFLTRSMAIYMIWFIPYAIYILTYSGKKITMITYRLRLSNEKIDKNTRILYLLAHLVGILIALSMGIFLMHNWILNYIAIIIQLLSGLVNGGLYYYNTAKKLA